jgi:hypothetical protein
MVDALANWPPAASMAPRPALSSVEMTEVLVLALILTNCIACFCFVKIVLALILTNCIACFCFVKIVLAFIM